MKIKRILFSFATALMALTICGNTSLAAIVSPQAQILLDEANLRLEVPPVNDQGTVMVPMRPIFEALQANVSWDQSKKTVTAVKKEVNIQLTVGSLSAMVNDREVHLAKAPYIYDGNTMVPVRFISETFGAEVLWFQARQTVAISTGLVKANGFIPEILRIQFVPSQDMDGMLARAKPLEKILQERLGIPVQFTVDNDIGKLSQAIVKRNVDIGFMFPSQYVLVHDNLKAGDVLLQALRYGLDDATGIVSNELVDYYKGMIVVRSDSPIQTVSDLAGINIGYQGTTSATGYVYPGMLMLKNGIDPEKDVNYTLYQGHDKAIIGLLNGQVDAAFVFQDIRYNMLKYYPKIMEQTRVVAFTERIPTDTITVRSDMNPTWRMKVEDAFITLASDPQVWKIFNDVFGHRGYVISTDEKFNIVREAIELMVKKP